jgi:hypothetical protein
MGHSHPAPSPQALAASGGYFRKIYGFNSGIQKDLL